MGNQFYELSEITKALADENRLKILALLNEGEWCVCNIQGFLALSQPNASRHLSKLKSAGLITARKTAQWVRYSINEELKEEFPFFAELLKSLPPAPKDPSYVLTECKHEVAAKQLNEV